MELPVCKTISTHNNSNSDNSVPKEARYYFKIFI